MSETDQLAIAGKSYGSRLIIGTGKYETHAENAGGASGVGRRDRHGCSVAVNLFDPTKLALDNPG